MRAASLVPMLVAGCTHPSPSVQAPPTVRFLSSDDIAILPDSGPLLWGRIAPRFPPRREEGGLPSVIVIVAYVVDTSGRTELATVSFLESPPRDPNELIPHGFRLSVCDFLRDARFKPATVGGQPQRALVIQPFVFHSDGAPPAPNVARYENAIRQMPPDEVFEWLAELPACDSRRGDSFYR